MISLIRGNVKHYLLSKKIMSFSSLLYFKWPLLCKTLVLGKWKTQNKPALKEVRTASVHLFESPATFHYAKGPIFFNNFLFIDDLLNRLYGKPIKILTSLYIMVNIKKKRISFENQIIYIIINVHSYRPQFSKPGSCIKRVPEAGSFALQELYKV